MHVTENEWLGEQVQRGETSYDRRRRAVLLSHPNHTAVLQVGAWMYRQGLVCVASDPDQKDSPAL